MRLQRAQSFLRVALHPRSLRLIAYPPPECRCARETPSDTQHTTSMPNMLHPQVTDTLARYTMCGLLSIAALAIAVISPIQLLYYHGLPFVRSAAILLLLPTGVYYLLVGRRRAPHNAHTFRSLGLTLRGIVIAAILGHGGCRSSGGGDAGDPRWWR